MPFYYMCRFPQPPLPSRCRTVPPPQIALELLRYILTHSSSACPAPPRPPQITPATTNLFSISIILSFQECYIGNSLVAQWLGLRTSPAGGLDLIPGWGTKIPQAARCNQKKKGMLHKWNHMVTFWDWLLSQYNAREIHPGCCVLSRVPFPWGAVFRGMGGPQFVWPFTQWRTSVLFPVLASKQLRTVM